MPVVGGTATGAAAGEAGEAGEGGAPGPTPLAAPVRSLAAAMREEVTPTRAVTRAAGAAHPAAKAVALHSPPTGVASSPREVRARPVAMVTGTKSTTRRGQMAWSR